MLTHDSLDNLDQIFQIKIQNDELCTISYWEDGNISKYTGKILKRMKLVIHFPFLILTIIYILNNANVCSINTI